MDMFEKSIREKVRFSSRFGIISLEDLYDLPKEELDAIYRCIRKEINALGEDRLLGTETKADRILALKANLVRHVFEIKIKEEKEALMKAQNLATRRKLLGIVARKQDADLEGKSIDELNKMIDELE